MAKLVGLVGSFRAEEFTLRKLKLTADLFADFSMEIGQGLAESGHCILCAWSNDHLEAQWVGGKFRFEETFEYSALKGYLAAAAATPSPTAIARVYISDEMWNGATSATGRKVEPVSQDVVATSLTLSDCREQGLLEIIPSDGTEAGNLLRSEMLPLVVQRADVVLAMGGGKATHLSHFVEPQNWFVLDFFGGTTGKLPDVLLTAIRAKVPSYDGDLSVVDAHSRTLIVESIVEYVGSVRRPATQAPVPKAPVANVDTTAEGVLARKRVRDRMVEKVDELKQDLSLDDLVGSPLFSERECSTLLNDLKALQFKENDTAEFYLSMTKGQLSFGSGLLEALRQYDDQTIGTIGKEFVLHELAHGRGQGIRSSNFEGVGRAAVALEQVDYMADAFALRTLARHELRQLAPAKQEREAGKVASALTDSTLSAIEAFDKIGGATRMQRLPERRLRRYLIWYLQRARSATITRLEHLDGLFNTPMTVELAPLPGTLDPYRLEKVIDSVYTGTALFCAIGGRLLRVDPAPKPGPERIFEAICAFDRGTVNDVMERLVETHGETLAPWTSP
jgi:hypothetical protein